ncbi:hypothetical protein PhaeoP18_02298 [Phaeobacter piscinae]|uniref:Uncharacterized protein n=1 Tax=Phaeobacter piscinae TaxID=1580596 RepID=A0AAN1GSJ1_9RHOB|nr:hypothetical protein PhaeoP13_02337 [Phaeobacter piscinae]AUR36554.1 hypothetical protein PhaeoP18_02298 [Phaeobacter piscinae]
MRSFLSTPFANFCLCILCIFLFFVVPKLLSGFLNPIIPMVVVLLAVFYFGRRMVSFFEG